MPSTCSIPISLPLGSLALKTQEGNKLQIPDWLCKAAVWLGPLFGPKRHVDGLVGQHVNLCGQVVASTSKGLNLGPHPPNQGVNVLWNWIV